MMKRRRFVFTLGAGAMVAPISSSRERGTLEMIRTTIAFIVAPLFVPAAMAAYVYFVLHLAHSIWMVVPTIASSICSYGGMFAFGLPAFFWLRSRHLAASWIAVGLGTVSGLATLIAVVIWSIWLGSGVQGVWLFLHGLPSLQLSWLMFPSLTGLGVGVTFWLIARPDRYASRRTCEVASTRAGTQRAGDRSEYTPVRGPNQRIGFRIRRQEAKCRSAIIGRV